MQRIAVLLLCAAAACAQDPFEIHVYEYDPMPLGTFSYETHVNYVVDGATEYSRSVAPSRHQLHYTTELTAGLGDSLALGTMLLTAVRPGQTIDYAGWRIIPHVFAPKSWNLPFNVGVLAEFSFERPAYEEDARHLELRIVVEKHIGRLQLDANPVFARALTGPRTNEGWAFEPSGRVGWQVSRRFTPSLEYYSSWGMLRGLLPLSGQVQQLVPGADLRIKEQLTLNVGAGFGLTPAGETVFLKTRLEWTFGRAVRANTGALEKLRGGRQKGQ